MRKELALIITVVLALSAVAVLVGIPGERPQEQPEGERPEEGAATITMRPIIGIAYAAGTPTYSGIENVYIMKHATDDNSENLKDHENILEYSGTDCVLTASGGTVNIPYNQLFDIIVTVRVDNENCYSPNHEENYAVQLIASGQATISENSTNATEYTIDNFQPDYVRVNAVWDNSGHGYKLLAGETISLDNIALWVWG